MTEERAGAKHDEDCGANEHIHSDITRLATQVDRLHGSLERLHLAEYVKLLDRPWHLLWLNLISGMARGLGMAIGFTLLGALLVYVLQRSVLQNLPIIGRVIAELVKIVERQLNR